MRTVHLTTLSATFLVLWFLADACAHAVKPRPDPEPKLTAWTLSSEAKDDEAFCVIIDPSPAYPPEAIGLHCARVGDVRMWLGHLKYAH